MTYYYCDGTGKLIEYNPKEIVPSIMHLYKYTFSREFYEDTVQPALDKMLADCGNDMSIYLKKQIELLENFVKKRKKKK